MLCALAYTWLVPCSGTPPLFPSLRFLNAESKAHAAPQSSWKVKNELCFQNVEWVLCAMQHQAWERNKLEVITSVVYSNTEMSGSIQQQKLAK